MENTNCGCDCPFVKQGFCTSDKECPFYNESIWQTRGATEIQTVKDCFPKRFGMEQSNLSIRFLTLQQLQEDLRNRMDRIELMLNTLIQQSQTFLQMKMQEENKGKDKTELDASKSQMQIE